MWSMRATYARSGFSEYTTALFVSNPGMSNSR
jgi:hypothetical protein